MSHCVHIPSWDEINRKKINYDSGLGEELDPVEEFIWEYEPADSYDCFREDFLNALDFISIGTERRTHEPSTKR